ncbi:MAG: ferritin-like domain-containing protein [Actinobacteria bacterium]|nr:ferritin-like domain-containing protein [Actinomycetota bacterium]
MSQISRRELLRLSATSLASGLVLAACGKQSGVQDDGAIARLGEAPSTTALAEAEVNDVVLLRTASSLEYNAIDTYTAALGLGVFKGDLAGATEIAKRFREDHQNHADAVNGLVRALGGKEYRCANTRINDLYLAPALALITDEKNPNVGIDVVALAHALENLAAQTYQGVVELISDPKLRADAIRIGQQESRHAALLAQVLNPGLAAVGPTFDETTGKPKIAAIPGAFGSQTNIQLTVGAPKDDGSRTTLLLETPSLNSLIYEGVSC